MKRVSTRKKKNQQKTKLSQLKETSNDFVIGTSANVNVSESETLGQQNNGQNIDFEKFGKSARQNKVIEKNIDNQVSRAVSSAVMTVENRMHDAILTTIDNVVIPRVEMAVEPITRLAGHRTGIEIQNLERRDFVRNIRNTLLISASSQLDLDNELNRIEETREDVGFGDSDFPALKSNYDGREQIHHNCSKRFFEKVWYA